VTDADTRATPPPDRGDDAATEDPQQQQAEPAAPLETPQTEAAAEGLDVEQAQAVADEDAKSPRQPTPAPAEAAP
jgi:hypothetical protein